jgi:hypothetical protein
MEGSPTAGRLCLVLAVLGAVACRTRAQCPGVPTFTAPVAYAASPGTPVLGIAHGDLDRDGDLDLVVCAGAQIVVLRNLGAGVFAPEPPVPAPAALSDLVVADVNADGFPDVLAAGTLSTTTSGATVVQAQIVVFVNQTAGTPGPVAFAAPVAIPFGTQAPSGSVGNALEVADLNADGILDVVAVDANSASVWVMLGQGTIGLGNGTFGAPVSYATLGSLNQGVAIADFDQDGAPDLAVVQYGGCNCPTTVTLLAGVVAPGGLLTGTFASAGSVTLPGPSECEDVVAADLNADGLLDLAVSSYLSIDVAYGTGGFGFAPAAYPGGAYPVQIAAGDFSGDGLVDLAAVRSVPLGSGYGNFTVLTGLLAGGFAAYDPAPLNDGIPRCITAADFDGDGKLDVAAGQQTGSIDVCFATCPLVTPRTVSMVWPNGGEFAGAGFATPMVWSKSASVPLVDLDLSHDGGTTWRRLATAVSGTNRPWIAIPPGSVSALARVSASGIPSVSDVSDLAFMIGGPGAAGTTSIGPGCGPSAQPPTLIFGTPQLGQAMMMDVQGASASTVGAVLISPVPPASSVVSPSCSAYLDLSTMFVLGGFWTDATGAWNTQIWLPSLSALAGSVVRAQAIVGQPLVGLELTNGVELTIGF